MNSYNFNALVIFHQNKTKCFNCFIIYYKLNILIFRFIVPLVMAVDEDHPMLSQMLSPFPLLRRVLARLLGSAEMIFETVERYYPNEFTKKIVFFVSIHFFDDFKLLLSTEKCSLIN